MGLGADLGKNAGESAAEIVHDTVNDALPKAEAIATEVAGSIERSVGALCTVLSSVSQQGPENIVRALDGLTVTITISRRKE